MKCPTCSGKLKKRGVRYSLYGVYFGTYLSFKCTKCKKITFENKTMKQPTVYYDGSCTTCSSAIRKYNTKIPFAAVDSSKMTKYQKALHIETESGMKIGIDALIYLWRKIPNKRWLASFASFPLFYPFFKLGYYLFARLRHR